MERNSSGALRRGTSDPHVTLSSCSLHITHVCWLPAVLRPSAAPAPPAPLSAAFGSTAVLPHPASLACDDASAAR
jgi:hypothetical protein